VNGANPVAMIFAREITPGLTSLVKKLDDATANNRSCKMGSFVTFCSDDESLEQKLKDLAKTEGLKQIVLTIDNPSGPSGYNVNKEADITVVLYTKRTVKANYAFKKGEMKDKDIEAIVNDVAKIVPEKK
jgi:hypothetical protein